MQDSFQKSKILYTGERGQGAFPQRRRRSRRWVWAFGIIFSFFVTGAGAWYALQQPIFRFTEFRLMGLRATPQDAVLASLRSEFAGMRFMVIPRDSYFIVSSESLEAYLKRAFPRIASVAVAKKIGEPLDLSFTERTLWGILCAREKGDADLEDSDADTVSREQQKESCFYIDRAGYAFEDVSSFAGSLFPVLFVDHAGALGEQLVTPDETAFFEEASSFLRASAGLSLFSAEFSRKNPDDVRLRLKEGWHLIVPREKNPAEWVAILKTLLAGEVRDKQKNLLYVDLRFGNKVFYKFR